MYVFYDVEPFHPAQMQQNLKDRSGTIPVRRPIWGLEVKKETYATLQVLSRRDGSWVEMLNSSVAPQPSDSKKSGGPAYLSGTSNFLITQVRHSRRERLQMVETYADTFLYVFGGSPKFLDVQGLLLNTDNFPWRTEWLRNYDTYINATKLVENAARIYLTVDDTTYEGYLIGCEVVDQVDPPGMSPMQFTMFLTNVIYAEVYGANTDHAVSGNFTRASTTEYLVGEDGSKNQDYVISLDSYGNIVVLDPNRISDALLAAERIRATTKAYSHFASQWGDKIRSLVQAAIDNPPLAGRSREPDSVGCGDPDAISPASDRQVDNGVARRSGRLSLRIMDIPEVF